MIRLLFKIELVFAFILFAGIPQTSESQVLEPPAKVNDVLTKKIQIGGTVTKGGKYSFEVTSDGQRYLVKPAPAVVVTLRLNKPFFDFENRQVKVQRSIPIANSSVSDSVDPQWVHFELPESLFVVSRFEHDGILDRFMKMPVKRVNNYLLSGTNPGVVHPAQGQLLMAGQLKPTNKGNVANLEIGDKSYKSILGHRKAFMTGFSVADLIEGSTDVFVWGQVDSENTILSHRIEFQPILHRSASDQVSIDN